MFMLLTPSRSAVPVSLGVAYMMNIFTDPSRTRRRIVIEALAVRCGGVRR